MEQHYQIKRLLSPIIHSPAAHYLLVIALIALTALCCIPLSNTQGYYIVSFILLFEVSVMATFMRMGPILLASTLSSLVWNFLFIPPHYTFHIDKPEDILMFAMFFIIVLLNGILTSRIRKQERLARSREERTNALFQLTRGLSEASRTDEILQVAEREIRKQFRVEPVFLLQKNDQELSLTSDRLKTAGIAPGEADAAILAFRQTQPTGRFTSVLPACRYTWYPLSGARLNPGVAGILAEHRFSDGKMLFWNTFLTLIAGALEREFLEELARKASFLDESDRLYKTLFNSISHELRIPVATILGASDTLLARHHSENTRSVLYNEIFTASVRLNRLIENLLNMSRLESGQFAVHPDWCDIRDLINKVTADLKDELKPFSVETMIPEDMPLVRIDFGLMEQVLYNLLYNASQHAPPASMIHLNVRHEKNQLIMSIRDQGPGFPPGTLQDVFKKFFRTDHKSGGLGLGLSIVKGFVEAHKGVITVENREEGGACFTITIPSELTGKIELS
ncbi:MAG: ATP-binding protein [Mangrovibacterium sp.]